MPSRTITSDAVVVGAGTAGANAAYQLARRGLSVILVERRVASEGGAQWTNGVLDWQFQRAGLDPPEGAERVSAHRTTHLVGPDGSHGVTVKSPTVTADMGLLGARLRSLAASEGVEIIDRAENLTVKVDGGRLRSVSVEAPVRSRPGSVELSAPLFVDASGRGGVLRRAHPTLRRWCPKVRTDELCSAADFHFEVADSAGASEFAARHRALAGETVTAVGTAGGFSTEAVTVSDDLSEVGILVGCLADGRYGTGPRLLKDLRQREKWIGREISGGFGVIPLRRPYSRFTAPGLALVGDAACQVFPAHGSGIGLGLIAGTMLADAVEAAADIGDETVLWSYQAAFQREFGGLLISSDAFRRLSTTIGGSGAAALVAAGLMTESTVTAGLDQRTPEPSPSELLKLAGRLARSPGLARKLVPGVIRTTLGSTLGSRYPERVDEHALASWDGLVSRIIGHDPR